MKLTAAPVKNFCQALNFNEQGILVDTQTHLIVL